MTIIEIAEWFGVTPRTVHRWIADGRLRELTIDEVMDLEDEILDARTECKNGHDRDEHYGPHGCRECNRVKHREQRKVGAQ